MSATKPQARIQLSLSTSTEQLSLSKPEQTTRIDVKAKTISSSKPNSGIRMNARWTALDDGNGISKGAIFARSTPADSTHLNLGPLVHMSYSRDGWDPDLRKCKFEHFVVVPAVNGGDLTVTHELSVERLFKFARVKASDIEPGTRFKFRLFDQQLPARWWSFDDETEGKKLYEGIFSNEYGLDGLADEDPEAIKKLYSEGWMYSYPLRDLAVEVKEDDSATFTFTA